MPWWTKASGSAAETPVGRASRGTEFEVVPGDLHAWVYPHEIPSQRGLISCWSYVSRGLAAFEQPEIVFTLRRDPDSSSDSFPHDPLHLFATLYRFASGGRRVGRGDITEFGDERFLGHHLLYVGAQTLDGVPLPPSALAALLITPDELRAVCEFGPTRVLARMGQRSTFYPFPPWSDLRRPGLSLGSTFERSVLSKMARVLCAELSVTIVQHQIHLSALRAVQPSWSDRLTGSADDVPLALLTSVDPSADGCLVWEPGQRGPEAITPPGSDASRLCGCFVGLLPGQPASGGQIVEDGLVMKLTTGSWNALRGALSDGRDLVIPADAAEMSLVLTWRESEDVGAGDGESHVDDSGGVTDQSTSAAPEAAVGTWQIEQVRLLIPEHELAARTTPEEVAAFCREVARCAQQTIGGSCSAELMVRMRCEPSGHDVDLASRGDVSQPQMRAFFEAMAQLASLPVKAGEVSFEITLGVSSR